MWNWLDRSTGDDTREYRFDLTACGNVKEAVVHWSCIGGVTRGMVVPRMYTATGAVTRSSGFGTNCRNHHHIQRLSIKITRATFRRG